MTESKLKNKTSDAREKVSVGKAFSKVAIYIALSAWGLAVLFPFYFMILTSIKTRGEYDNPDLTLNLYTLYPTVKNYFEAFTKYPLDTYFLNTLIFTVATTALMIIVSVLAAFAFARLEFKGKNIAFTLILSLMMIPSELVVITNYATIVNPLGDLSNITLDNTFAGLILPSVASVFYIYLLKENFSQVPDELYYAAQVDGTTDLKYLFKVMVPICRPTIVTVIILKVIECWNSYVWPRLITEEDHYLVSNGIQYIRESGSGRANIPAMMAAVVIVSVPLVVLFLIFRKKIMAGVSRGGLKG